MVLKQGDGCAKCADKCPIQAREILYSQAIQRGYQILGDYVNTHTKIAMLCPDKHRLEITPHSFKQGHGCGICEESAGEQLLRATLISLNRSLKSQYILPLLPNRKYDFVNLPSSKI